MTVWPGSLMGRATVYDVETTSSPSFGALSYGVLGVGKIKVVSIILYMIKHWRLPECEGARCER